MRPAQQVKQPHEYYDDGDPWYNGEPGKTDQIYEWVTNTGDGLMHFSFGDVPPECIDFCYQQYARFKVPFPAAIHDVAVSGASAAFYYADVIDPYVLFKGVSDVDLTFDWCEITYQIHNADGSPITREADPQFLETFRAMPGQAERMFAEMVMRPGLKALPFHIGYGIEEVLEGRGDEVWESIGSEVDTALRSLCQGSIDTMYAYFELAAWSGFIWLAGPYGRAWRAERHELMECAMTHGECILVDGTIVPPGYYTKIARPPMSCHKCGTQAWCVEQTMVGPSTAFICEACLNFDAPKYGSANCGTKYCKNSLCPNHPFAHLGRDGIYDAVRTSGQLTEMARSGSTTLLHGYQPLARLR